MRIEQGLTDTTVQAELGRRVAHARLARNVSQRTLAHEAGVGVATIERLEAGHNVKLLTLIAVLRTLGLTDALESMLPEARPGPVEAAATGGRGRRRARAAARPDGPPTPDRPWRWGDER